MTEKLLTETLKGEPKSGATYLHLLSLICELNNNLTLQYPAPDVRCSRAKIHLTSPVSSNNLIPFG